MKDLKKLVLLHSNDMHGDFMAENVDDKLVGGVSMLSGYVSKVRAEEENVLYCVAGDMFRGSVIDSEYQGISTIEIMNGIAPDIVTVGNHEVDYGVAHLLFIEKCAKFPIINANLHVTTNGARLFQPYKILTIGGMKVLFIGILTDEVLASARKEGLIGSFVNCEEAASEVGRICNAYNSLDIDFTVLLTHIGFEEDQKLASLLDPSWGVDVIIGGHSHTLPDEPCIVNGIPIVQAGTGTDQIGRFDIMIDMDRNCIDSYTWQIIPINEDTCPRDMVLEKVISSYKDQTDLKYNRIVTKFTKVLTHPTREQETALGNLFADALKESLGLDVMLQGSGGIRKKELGPLVTYGDFMECFPFNEPVYMLLVSGKEFKHMIKFMLRDEMWKGDHCEFYQVSNSVEVIYNKTTHKFEKFDLNGEPLEDDRLITIGLAKYHYLGTADNFGISRETLEAKQRARIIATSDNQVVEEYFSSHQMLDSEVYGRIVVKE